MHDRKAPLLRRKTGIFLAILAGIAMGLAFGNIAVGIAVGVMFIAGFAFTPQSEGEISSPEIEGLTRQSLTVAPRD